MIHYSNYWTQLLLEKKLRILHTTLPTALLLLIILLYINVIITGAKQTTYEPTSISYEPTSISYEPTSIWSIKEMCKSHYEPNSISYEPTSIWSIKEMCKEYTRVPLVG